MHTVIRILQTNQSTIQKIVQKKCPISHQFPDDLDTEFCVIHKIKYQQQHLSHGSYAFNGISDHF